MMSNDVEELSEDMKREHELDFRKSVGKTTLAFIDLENMSPTVYFGFILFAVVFFSIVAIFFYKNLFETKKTEKELRQERLAAKRTTKKD